MRLQFEVFSGQRELIAPDGSWDSVFANPCEEQLFWMRECDLSDDVSCVESVVEHPFAYFFNLSVHPCDQHGFPIQRPLVLSYHNRVEMIPFLSKLLDPLVLFVIKFPFKDSSVSPSAAKAGIVFSPADRLNFPRVSFELQLVLVNFSGVGGNHLYRMHAAGSEQMSSIWKHDFSDTLHRELLIHDYLVFQHIQHPQLVSESYYNMEPRGVEADAHRFFIEVSFRLQSLFVVVPNPYRLVSAAGSE